jgi:hypothetical protein
MIKTVKNGDKFKHKEHNDWVIEAIEDGFYELEKDWFNDNDIYVLDVCLFQDWDRKEYYTKDFINDEFIKI